jgi:hypothetical protein
MLLCSLLWVMSYRLPTLLLAGRYCLSSSWPFVLSVPEMAVAERSAMLRGWARSPLPDLRQVMRRMHGTLLSLPACLTGKVC